MKRWLFVLVALAVLFIPTAAYASQTTADVVVTATPSFISISVSPGLWDAGFITESTTDNTTTSYFTVTNASSIVTDQTISVNTADNWTGGIGWIHSDTATPGANQVGLLANKDGTWGTSDIKVKRIAQSPNLIGDNVTAGAGGNYDFGLAIVTPTSFGDGVEKEVTVRVTAAAAN